MSDGVVTKEKILVIDDEPDLVGLLIRIFTRDGFEVLFASNAKDGLNLARTENPDLIMTDLRMPDMSGLELINILSADPELSFLPIVLLTATDDNTLRIEAERASVDLNEIEVIKKPIPDIMGFSSRIRKVLEGSRSNN